MADMERGHPHPPASSPAPHVTNHQPSARALTSCFFPSFLSGTTYFSCPFPSFLLVLPSHWASTLVLPFSQPIEAGEAPLNCLPTQRWEVLPSLTPHQPDLPKSTLLEGSLEYEGTTRRGTNTPGKCQFPVAGPLYGHDFDYGLGGTSWPSCPMVLGRLIHRSVENFNDRPLNVLLLDQALE